MGATCFAHGDIQRFFAFATTWPLQSRSRSFFEVKSGKCDLLCAKQVALSSRVTTFQTLLTLRGQDSESNDPYLGRVRPALRKAGRTLAIGLRGSKKCRKMKVPRMTFAIVENVPTSWESIFKLFPTSQCPYSAKLKILTKKYIKI